MRKTLPVLALLLAAGGGARAEASVQQQLDELKAQVDYITQNYERTEPIGVIKKVTEYVSPGGEIFTEPQKGGVSPTDGSKLEKRVTYRELKFSRRESVDDKIEAAIDSAINGHVIVGLEMVGSYFNTVGAGDVVDALGQTRSANRGHAEGAIDLNFSAKPMRNTVMFADLDLAGGTAALSEAWIAVSGPRNIVSFQVGVIDMTAAFDGNAVANDETVQFLTPDFVNSPLLANPANALGAVLRAGDGRWEAALGAQNTLAALNDVTDDVYAAAELGLRWHLWGDHHTRVWARQQPRGSQQPDQALGFSTDHRLSTCLSVFGRYAKSSYVEAYDEATDTHGALNAYDWAASAGLELTNFNRRNLKERLGVAYGRTQGQDGAYTDELEIYNRIPLTPNFAVGLHYQAAFSLPAGLGLDGNPSSHTVGLRVQSTY